MYGSPANRLRKNPSLSQRAAQHKIFGKVEIMFVRLKKGDGAFDRKSALMLAGLDAHDDSPRPATRLIASAFDIKENCGSVKATRHVPKEHQEAIRSGLVDSSVISLHKFASIDPRDKAEYALLVVRKLHARKVDLRCRVSGGGAIFSAGKKDSDKLREIWDGSRVSGASVHPPPPPRLLTPDALLQLECPPGQQLR